MKRKISSRLLAWKKAPGRMPLILDGARQVGKTWSLVEFGRENFENIAYVNLETARSVSEYFTADIDPVKTIRFLETWTGQRIIPGKTLIILDEIQSCERALTALKYFCEQVPEYHVAAAGSLLGVAINRERFSFPVGKVETLTLFPLDFEEYLWAHDQASLADRIRDSFLSNEPLSLPLHERALELYRSYLVTGGMPACVTQYLETGSLIAVPERQNRILNDYIADMAKYATNTESVKIRSAFNSIPGQLAKDNRKFQYKMVQKGGTATIFGPSLEWLKFAGIVLSCTKTAQGFMPIAVHADFSSFKLYMGDVGLLTAKSGIPPQTILSPGSFENSFSGALAENYVAQSLAANGHPLYYWESKNSAEVDFVLQLGTDVIPLEVKAGIHTRSKSLQQFMQLYDPPYVIRISAKQTGFENRIKSVPLYAVFCIT